MWRLAAGRRRRGGASNGLFWTTRSRVVCPEPLTRPLHHPQLPVAGPADRPGEQLRGAAAATRCEAKLYSQTSCFLLSAALLWPPKRTQAQLNWQRGSPISTLTANNKQSPVFSTGGERLRFLRSRSPRLRSLPVVRGPDTLDDLLCFSRGRGD